MEIGFAWLGISAGLIGTLITYFAARSQSSPEFASDKHRIQLSTGLTAVLTLIIWTVSMKKSVPFSPGQTLGYGFLIGGMAGALAGILAFAFESRPANQQEPRKLAQSANSMAFFGLFGVSLTFLIFHNYPQMALIGFSIGAAMAAILRFFLQSLRTDQSSMLTELWAVFAITLASAIVLAVYHFNNDSVRMWWALPILIGASVCISSYIALETGFSNRFTNRPATGYIISTSTAAALTIALSAVYSAYIAHSWQLLGAVAVGTVIFAFIAWLAASYIRDDNRAGALEAAAASVLLIIAGTVVAFKIWSGLGIGIGLIAAWAILIPMIALREKALPKALTASLALGLTIVLFRLFIESYRYDLGTADLRIHYTFVGALLGAIAPFLFASSLMRLGALLGKDESTTADYCALVGVSAIGLLAAASPVVLFAIWQIKAVLGFMFGLIAAQAFLLIVQIFDVSCQRDEQSMTFYSTSLLTIGAQLVAIQFIRPLLTWESTRTTRIWVLAIAAAIAALWVIATSFISRRSAR